MHNSSFNATHCACSLGFIFNQLVSFSDQFHLSPKPAIIVLFVNCAVSDLTSIPQFPLPCTIATSVVHSKPDHKHPITCLQTLRERTYLLSRLASRCRRRFGLCFIDITRCF